MVRRRVQRHRFPAMGSVAEITIVGGATARTITDGADALRLLERRWSRFVDDSEISRLNRLAGQPVVVSDDTLLLAELATLGRELTGGRFDPLVLGAVRSIGYTDDLESVRAGRAPVSLPAERVDASAYRSVTVDRDRRTVTIPAGHGFDPGGIGKGLAADLVAARLMQAQGVVGACVNVGGDLRVAGCGPSAAGWRIRADDRTVETTEVGVATSSVRQRTWEFNGDRVHHLIDATTGRPAVTDAEFVTVIAPFAWCAEVHATAAATGSSSRVIDDLTVGGLEGLVVGGDGQRYMTDGLRSVA